MQWGGLSDGEGLGAGTEDAPRPASSPWGRMCSVEEAKLEDDRS